MDAANRSPSPADGAAARDMQKMTRRSFAAGVIAAAAGFGTWRWLTGATEDHGIPWPLRRALRFNQSLAEAYASPRNLAPTFPLAAVREEARVNGNVGLFSEVQSSGWQLRVQHAGRAVEQAIPLQAIQDLPRADLVTELKCVEGWGQVIHFGGVRFLDFLTKFGLGTRSGAPPDVAGDANDLYRYVYLATPDESYYVGLDMASALHPQTLLCDTMNQQALTTTHGAPLRLYLSVKYGYKSLKRIGLIRFQDELPRDYWADRGYDWYAGL
jgi:DMSO/TMAO reductase YedYZ molybdopterin-dependent catalytic subunit